MRPLNPNSTAGKMREMLTNGATVNEVVAVLGVKPQRVYAERNRMAARQQRISKVTGKPVRKYVRKAEPQAKPQAKAKKVTGVKADERDAQIKELLTERATLLHSLELLKAEVSRLETRATTMHEHAAKAVSERIAAERALEAYKTAPLSKRMSYMFKGVL